MAEGLGDRTLCSASEAASAGRARYPDGRTALSRKDFEAIRDLAYRKFGLDLKKGKEELVAARLSKKLREHDFDSFRDYYQHVLEDATEEALIGLIDALTTNHTGFLREPAHFDYLREVIVPRLGKRRIEIWSAACSSGEEPYSIACSLLEAGVELARVRILASDISTAVLRTAQQAVYPAESCRELPESWTRKYFMRGIGRWEGWMRIKPEIRERIEFRRVNLIEPVDQAGTFPVIFCRNVMIYFDKPTQERVIAQLSQRLEPGGCLLVGHAESLAGVRHSLRYTRPGIFQRESDSTSGKRR